MMNPDLRIQFFLHRSSFCISNRTLTPTLSRGTGRGRKRVLHFPLRPYLNLGFQVNLILIKHLFPNEIDELEHVRRTAAGVGDDEIGVLGADFGTADLSGPPGRSGRRRSGRADF